jgi:hypothetical protein
MDGRRKLTPEQVMLVRQRVAEGVKQDSIAREFGISTQHVSRIKHNQRHASCVNQTAGRALDWLLAGGAVRRSCWLDTEHLRYSGMAFQLWVDNECSLLESFDISGYDMTVNDWILGVCNKTDDSVIWPKGWKVVE